MTYLTDEGNVIAQLCHAAGKNGRCAPQGHLKVRRENFLAEDRCAIQTGNDQVYIEFPDYDYPLHRITLILQPVFLIA